MLRQAEFGGKNVLDLYNAFPVTRSVAIYCFPHQAETTFTERN